MMRYARIIGVAVVAMVGAAQAEDGFTTIHMDNQKIGSAVSAYWRSQATSGSAVLAIGFMAIHMDNQKSGSAVAAYWRTIAHPLDPAPVDYLVESE